MLAGASVKVVPYCKTAEEFWMVGEVVVVVEAYADDATVRGGREVRHPGFGGAGDEAVGWFLSDGVFRHCAFLCLCFVLFLSVSYASGVIG